MNPTLRHFAEALGGIVTPCMPCTFSVLRTSRSGAVVQLNGAVGVTVVVRWIPLVTAAYGTRVAGPARTTMARAWWRRLRADPEGETRPRWPVHRCQEPERARGRFNLCGLSCLAWLQFASRTSPLRPVEKHHKGIRNNEQCERDQTSRPVKRK
jgi:hypothetical protein